MSGREGARGLLSFTITGYTCVSLTPVHLATDATRLASVGFLFVTNNIDGSFLKIAILGNPTQPQSNRKNTHISTFPGLLHSITKHIVSGISFTHRVRNHYFIKVNQH